MTYNEWVEKHFPSIGMLGPSYPMKIWNDARQDLLDKEEKVYGAKIQELLKENQALWRDLKTCVNYEFLNEFKQQKVRIQQFEDQIEAIRQAVSYLGVNNE